MREADTSETSGPGGGGRPRMIGRGGANGLQRGFSHSRHSESDSRMPEWMDDDDYQFNEGDTGDPTELATPQNNENDPGEQRSGMPKLPPSSYSSQ